MKILYGIQATGNGHITRARELAPALKERGIEVDFLFSGRNKDEFFDMQDFGDYKVFRGLTFYMGSGAKVKLIDTFLKNSLTQLIRDIRALDTSGYDLVISDFEPITAWAAKLRGTRSLGIAHQYAFLYKLPDNNRALFLKYVVKLFAPVDEAVGVHWDHFGAPIVPPLIAAPKYPVSTDTHSILVYLPYDARDNLYRLFSRFSEYHFHVYTSIELVETRDNVTFHPLSRDLFERDLSKCAGVISNCGFGLASESMQYGKKLLLQPMKGQAEQQSNAEILRELGKATITDNLTPTVLAAWLESESLNAVSYPAVARQLACWIEKGGVESPMALAHRLWSGN